MNAPKPSAKKGIVVIAGICAVVGGLAAAGLSGSMGGGDEAEVEVLQMASAEQVDTFGTELATHLNENTVPPGLIDWEVLAGRTLPQGTSARQREEFIAGVATGAQENDLLTQFRQLMENGDRVAYRGVGERDGQPVARFRLILSAGGVNFFDFLIAMREGAPRIVDFFQLSTGSWQSEVVAEMFRGAFVEGPSAVERVMGERNPLVEHAEEIGRLGQLIQTREGEQAWALYQGLPEAVRHHRVVFGLAIDATGFMPLEDPRRLQILDEFAATFPNDPAAAARLLDAHFERAQWPAVHTDLDSLDGAFPDSYWMTMRARVFVKEGRFDEGRQAALRSIELEPELLETHDAALVVALATNDLEAANGYAMTLRDNYGVRFELLEGNADYVGVMNLPFMTGGAAAAPSPSAPEATAEATP